MAEEMAAGRPPDSNPDRTGGGDPRTLIVDSNPGQTGGSNPGPTGGGAPHWRTQRRDDATLKKLPFHIQRQQQPEWCWAAVAVSIDRYFDSGSSLTQADVADLVLARQDCKLAPEVCDSPQELKTALKKIHKWRVTREQKCAKNGSVVARGSLTFEELQREIGTNRPVCAGITWDTGDGHFVVLYGYRVLHSGERQVYVADPLNPSGLVDFDEFTSAYFGHGEWTETDLVGSDWESL